MVKFQKNTNERKIMFKLISKTIAAVAIVSIALFGSANAKTLKIETHFTVVHQMVKLQLNLLKT